MSVRVPDERLDEQQALIAAELHGRGINITALRALDALDALVSDLRDARAENEQLRVALARLIAVTGRDETWCDQAVSNGRDVVPCRLARGHRGPCEPTTISAHGNLLRDVKDPRV